MGIKDRVARLERRSPDQEITVIVCWDEVGQQQVQEPPDGEVIIITWDDIQEEGYELGAAIEI